MMHVEVNWRSISVTRNKLQPYLQTENILDVLWQLAEQVHLVEVNVVTADMEPTRDLVRIVIGRE